MLLSVYLRFPFVFDEREGSYDEQYDQYDESRYGDHAMPAIDVNFYR